MIPYKNSLPVRAILVGCLLFLSLLAGILVSLHDYKVRANPTYHNTDITSIEYWNATENPHIINGDIDINNGGILYIGAGAIVQFNGNNEIRVNNGCALYANGTDDKRITINSTSTGDKSIWRQIRFKTGSSGSIKYCNIIKGGKNSPAIEIGTSNVIIENCTIKFCRKAIYISNGNPIIQNNTIHNCTTAIEVDGGSPYIFNNNIYNITTTGINILVGSADIRMNKISSLDMGVALYKTGSVDRFDQNIVTDCAVGIWLEKIIKIENSTIKNSTQYDFQFNPPPSAKIFVLNSTFDGNSLILSTCKLIKQWFVHVFVNDTLGNPMENVDITITPNGQTAKNYKTDSSGWRRWVVCTEFENTSSSITYWTPYSIKVHKTGYNSTIIYPNISESKTFHFTLKDIAKPTSALDNIPHYWFNSFPTELSYSSSDNSYLKKVTLYYCHSKDNQTFSNAKMINSTDILGEQSSVDGAFTFKFNDGEGYYNLYTLATDIMDNTESFSSAEIIKLGYDFTPPEFRNIEVANITEDSKGICHVEVTIKDIYSGLAGVPKISFKYDSTDASWFMSDKNMKELKQTTVTLPNRGTEATYYYDMPMPGKGWDHYKDKSLKWEISCRDHAGNDNIISNLEKIDSVNHVPEIKFISPKSDSWNSGIVKIQTSPNDDLDIGDPSSEWGIDYVYAQYSLDSTVDGENGTWLDCTTSPTTSEPFDIYWNSTTVGTNDNVWLRVRCVDNGGLASNWDLLKIKIDNEPAVSHIESFADIWYNTDIQINLLASDGEGAGVENIYYKLNNGPSNSTQFGMPLITTENANNTIEYWSVDNQGNSELHKFKYGIKLDKTNPEIINVSVTNVTIYTDITTDIVLWANINDSLSGINGMPRLRVKYPGEDFNDWIDMELDSGSRYKTVLNLSDINLYNLTDSKLIFEVRAIDYADNTAYKIFSELIDNQTTELPEIMHTPVTEWYVNKQIIINAMIKYVRPIDRMVVHYKSVLGGSFESIEMEFVREDPDTEKSNWFIYLYTVELPAQSSPGKVHYYISAEDNLTTTTITSPEILPENNSFIINIIELKKETDDKVPDWWLEHYFGNIDEYISDGDPDNDGLTNMEEFENNTDPTKNDTDNDCLPDKWEIDNQMDPNDPDGKNGPYGDCDGDGISNLDEFEKVTKPTVIDDEPQSTPKQESEELKAGDDNEIYIGIIIVMVLIIILLLISLIRRKKIENESKEEGLSKKSNPGEDVEEESSGETIEDDEGLEDSENYEDEDYVEDLTSSEYRGEDEEIGEPGISDEIGEYEEDYDYEAVPLETEAAAPEQENELPADLEAYEIPPTDTEDQLDDAELPRDESDVELEDDEIKLGNHEEELLMKVKQLKEKIKKRDI